MSEVTEILENDLPGLPAVIASTLKAHPEWKRVDGKTICAGPGCDWVKPGGKSTMQRWLNHQTFELQWAIGIWYDDETEGA